MKNGLTKMRRMFLAGAVLTWVMAVFCTVSADVGHINVVQVQDTINPGVEDFLRYAIDRSQEEGAECLIILLDTPGGLMASMRGIAQAILNSPVPIVVYVYPSGAQAASAGVFVTVAGDIAAMAPGTNIGAAHPVSIGGGDVPSTMNEKVTNDMLAFARSIASQRGRNADWLEDSIRKSVSITAEEAYAQNVIDLVAEDLPRLIKKLDGWEIERKGYTKTLHTEGLEQRTIQPGWQHKVLRSISNPNIAYILLMIGLAGLYFELSQPGAILPGVIGGIALILALYAMQTLPVNYAGILFILLAVLFFILEIKVVSYGLLSFAGVLSLVLGSLMLFRVPGHTNRLAMSVFIPTVAVISGFFVAVATLAFRAQMRKPQTGAEALVGMIGEVKKDLVPEGQVFVNGELWSAIADENLFAGEKVEVISLENLRLKVRKISART
jgi:membrane-bound serine protease (ClpP class)